MTLMSTPQLKYYPHPLHDLLTSVALVFYGQQMDQWLSIGGALQLVCVCFLVCVSLPLDPYMYVCLSVFLRLSMYFCLSLETYVCLYVYVLLSMSVHLSVHACICLSVYVYLSLYARLQ